MKQQQKTLNPKPSLYERLFGEKIGTDDIDYSGLKGVDTSTPEYRESLGLDANDPDPYVNISVSNPQKYGGLLNDLTAGYKENRTTPLSMNNFGDNDLDFGRKKGLGYRLGEGLGTIGRVADSPLGRGLLTGAAIGLLGGNPAEMLTYGTVAGANNQANRTRDALYRQQLQKEGIDTTGMNGYITDSTYKSMLAAKQMRDNAEYRNAMLSNQQEQNKITNQLRQDQLERQARQDQLNNYYQGQRIAQGWANLNDRQQARAEAKAAKANADDFGDIQSQLDNFKQTFKTVDNPYRYRVFGGASEKLNTLSNDEANFNAQRTLLFNQIARKLGGEKGVLSDKDIARVEAALPKLTDTYDQKMAKMEALYDLLSIKRGSATQAVNNINATNNYNDGWAF